MSTGPAASVRLVQDNPTVGWLHSPMFDLVCVSSVVWLPIVLLSLALDGAFGADHPAALGLHTLNLYLLNSPHRWLTLLLVFGDPDKYSGRPRTFDAILVGISVASLGLYWLTGSWALQILVIFLMNKWHFSAQHHGILRIYARVAGHQQSEEDLWTEKWLLRSVIMYAGMRLIAWSSYADGVGMAALEPVFWVMDFVAMAAIAALVWRERALGLGLQQRGRVIYLASVLSVYGLLIGAAHFSLDAAIPPLVMGAAIIHGTEYFGISAWSMLKKKNPRGMWAYVVPKLGLMALIYLAFMMVTGYVMATQAMAIWIYANMVVTFAHYAYDAMIWRKPAPARA